MYDNKYGLIPSVNEFNKDDEKTFGKLEKNESIKDVGDNIKEAIKSYHIFLKNISYFFNYITNFANNFLISFEFSEKIRKTIFNNDLKKDVTKENEYIKSIFMENSFDKNYLYLRSEENNIKINEESENFDFYNNKFNSKTNSFQSEENLQHIIKDNDYIFNNTKNNFKIFNYNSKITFNRNYNKIIYYIVNNFYFGIFPFDDYLNEINENKEENINYLDFIETFEYFECLTFDNLTNLMYKNSELEINKSEELKNQFNLLKNQIQLIKIILILDEKKFGKYSVFKNLEINFFNIFESLLNILNYFDLYLRNLLKENIINYLYDYFDDPKKIIDNLNI